MTEFVGVDGCKAGWFFVRGGCGRLGCGIAASFTELIGGMPAGARVFVDIPIGLRDRCAEPRACDVEARKLLGRGRASSVFPPPLRAILGASSYTDALYLSRSLCGKGLSRQAFGIAPKIREVDDLLADSEYAQLSVREVHPEVCFWAFAGGKPMVHRKKEEVGFRERMALLERVFPGCEELVRATLGRYRRKDVARDDIADALVLAATASAPDAALKTIPAHPDYDARGLPMEMVYSAINLG